MTRDDLAAMLKAARVAAGLTQGELAARMGVAGPTVSRIETGDRLPSLDTIDAWARACGLDLRVTLAPPGDTPDPYALAAENAALRRALRTIAATATAALKE